jgi:vancomycin aglycone glucosyltransferase
MRVLLSTIGSRGDVQPLVALALALRAAGQEAHLCAPPDFREWIAGLGFPFTAVGPEVRHARPLTTAEKPVQPTREQLRQVIDATVAAQFEAITAAADGCDVILAATALQVAARSVAERLGIRYVFAAYSPTVLPSPHHAPPPLPPAPGEVTAPADNTELWARGAARFNDTFRDSLNTYRATLGLAPVDDVRSHMFTARPWLAADAALAPWPESAGDGVVQTGAWMTPDDRPLPAELEGFLDGGDPPVYFGFGSAPAPSALTEVLVQVVRALGRRAVVSRGWADLSVAQNERDCLVIGEVNQRALFSRAGAVVHHGGAGTTTNAALAGAPQVIVPQVYDQHYFAQRVQQLGIGVAHGGMPSSESLTQALEHVLRSEVAACAGSFATLVRRDGAQVAAHRLIDGC